MDIDEKPLKDYSRDILELFSKRGLLAGRMVGGSKSGYLERHPKHRVVFNANVATRLGKVWWGDLDLTLDGKRLKKVAAEMTETLYVLREMDARFDHEKDSPKILMSKAVWDTDNGWRKDA